MCYAMYGGAEFSWLTWGNTPHWVIRPPLSSIPFVELARFLYPLKEFTSASQPTSGIIESFDNSSKAHDPEVNL